MQEKKGYLKPPANPHNEPFVDGLNSVFETLHEHDDRGMVLTLAAFAEDTLGLLLLAFMREEKQAKELVEGFNAPLGTFSARIKAALALGLMLKDSYDALEILRKIRNAFAHDWEGVSLDRQDIEARVMQLSACLFEEIAIAEGNELVFSVRDKLINKMADVLRELRLRAKHMARDGVKVPMSAIKSAPLKFELIEVKSFSESEAKPSQ